jgi:hypothetical protein
MRASPFHAGLMIEQVDKVLMLTWFAHRRTMGICTRLGIPLFVLESRRSGTLRVVDLACRTLRLLRRKRPNVVVMQNPSLTGTVVVTLLRPVLGFRLVVDAHNEAVQPYVNRSRAIRAVSHWVVRRADLTIVTNAGLAESVLEIGGTPFVLPDPIPEPPDAHPKPVEAKSGRERLLVIATGAPDEPLAEIAEAARSLPGVIFRITGKLAPVRAALGNEVPRNVEFTGFVDERVYWTLLEHSDLVVDLTKMEDCLVCGAYEAVAVTTPMVLSDNRASRALFGEIACLVPNHAEAIVQGIKDSLGQIDELRQCLPAFRTSYVEEWKKSGQDLMIRLAQLGGA